MCLRAYTCSHAYTYTHIYITTTGSNKQALLAIVDVLLHDPLASWKMSPSKNKPDTSQVQEGSAAGASDENAGNSSSVDARFVKRTIEAKLEGRDRGELRESCYVHVCVFSC
jgi:hypothetical protein